MADLKQLTREVEIIKQRNKRVEAEKAWETSAARKAVIAVLTYLVIVLFMWSAKLPDPFTNAAVPTLGFILSTLSFPLFKDAWKQHFYKQR